MTFQEIRFDNLDEIVALTVGPHQTSLVADNAYSIAQALLDPAGRCRGAYVDGVPVGFFYTRILEDRGLVYICRFMVDHRQQGKGYGLRMMQKLLAEAFSSTATRLVDLAVSRDENGAERFYARCGFEATGERYRGGWRMVLPREKCVT